MSDQDFFFDEEDERPAKAAPKTPSKAGAKAPAKKTGASSPKADVGQPVAFFEQSVSMSIAAMLVVCGLLVGVIAGVLIGQARASSLPPDQTALTQGAGGSTAPQLSQDQMNSGQLPPGHPNISGSAGASGTAAPSSAATSGK